MHSLGHGSPRERFVTVEVTALATHDIDICVRTQVYVAGEGEFFAPEIGLSAAQARLLALYAPTGLPDKGVDKPETVLNKLVLA